MTRRGDSGSRRTPTPRGFASYDQEEKRRFQFATSPDGGAAFGAYDHQGQKTRFMLGTTPYGHAGLALYDPTGRKVWEQESPR